MAPESRGSTNAQAPALVVDGLVKRYPRRGVGQPVTAVDGVAFMVGRGEVLGLLGPNGAGKTTTIKMICGLLLPDAGTITIGGLDLARHRSACLAQIAAVLEGNRNLYWRLTPYENLIYFAGNRGKGGKAVRARAEELLERFGLAEKRNALVNDLSRGMQQKLAIAVALLADARIVLLDEPTLGLDVEAGYEIRNVLREVAASGRTVIVSTHDMPVVQDLCSRVVIVNGGRVIANDRVDALLKLFETRAYDVTLAAPLSHEQRSALMASFPALVPSEDGRSFNVGLEHGDEIFRLVSALEQAEVGLVALDRTTVDFEQVFRRLVANGQEVQHAR